MAHLNLHELDPGLRPALEAFRNRLEALPADVRAGAFLHAVLMLSYSVDGRLGKPLLEAIRSVLTGEGEP